MFFKKNNRNSTTIPIHNEDTKINSILSAFAYAVYNSSLTSGAGFEIKVEVESYYEHLKEIFHRTDQINERVS